MRDRVNLITNHAACIIPNHSTYAIFQTTVANEQNRSRSL